MEEQDKEQVTEEVEEKKGIDIFEYFGLKKEYNLSKNQEEIFTKIKDTLEFSVLDMGIQLDNWIQKNAEELSLELVSIVPFGDYSKLLDNNDDMSKFLKKNCVEGKHWDLISIHSVGELIKFEFRCLATDPKPTDGEDGADYNLNIVGHVLVGSKSKKIRHAFVQAN